MSDSPHVQRIKKELVAAGMSTYGLRKAESRYLPHIIHKDERIGGVVYGLYDGGGGMLIATDKRVIFLDKKPMFTTNDEVSYNVVSGLKINRSAFVNVITLHTRIKDYTLRYVNIECATKFKKYIESRSLEDLNSPVKTTAASTAEPVHKPLPFLTDQTIEFLKSNDIAVLSTSDKKGTVCGAVVYYVVDENHRVYILTKADTNKTRNIIAHSQVALTIFDTVEARTLQIQGSATIETDEEIKQHIFKTIMKPHKYKGGYNLPPVAWLDAGMFVIITINPKSANYSDFSNKGT